LITIFLTTVFCRLPTESLQSLHGLYTESTWSPHGPNVDCRKYSLESPWSPHGLHANSWASVKYSP